MDHGFQNDYCNDWLYTDHSHVCIWFFKTIFIRKKVFVGLGFISMYFSGGTIATFILVNWLKLYNTYWVYIIPALFGGFYNVIIYNANFKAIPESLFESAKIDGASEFKIFFSIVLPLSKPVLIHVLVFLQHVVCGMIMEQRCFIRRAVPYRH